MAKEKTNRLRFSRFHPGLKNRFAFLSFEFYWSKDKAGKSRLFRRTARNRLQSTKRDYSEFIKKSRHLRTPELIDKITLKLRGHYNYFGAVGNHNDLYRVYFHAVGMLYKWLNRRSGRKSMTWAKLKRMIAFHALAKPVCKAIVRSNRVWL